MKECSKCGITKPLTEFYKHKEMSDGRLNKCKECNKKDVKKNYIKNIKHFKNYDQIRNQKRKDYISKRNKIYQEKNPERVEAAKKRYAENNKLKRAAHIIFSNAFRSGKVKKRPCQICKTDIVEAHHFDYTKPLNVIWLCHNHHTKIHWWLRWNKRNIK